MSSDKFAVELSDKDPSATLRMACVLNTLHVIILLGLKSMLWSCFWVDSMLVKLLENSKYVQCPLNQLPKLYGTLTPPVVSSRQLLNQ